LTVTRYNKTALADEVLELIGSGTVKYQSFRGPVIRSAAPRRGPNGRPVIERMELGLKDYGPAVWAANTKAEIMAVRSQMLADQIGELDPDERRELISLLQQALHLDVDPPADPDPQPQPAADEVAPVDPGPSIQMLELANAQRHRR
jgi:hypothetical protein